MSKMTNSSSKKDEEVQVFTDKQMMLCVMAGCEHKRMFTGNAIAVITVNPVRINEDDKQVEIIEEVEGIERRIVFPKAWHKK